MILSAMAASISGRSTWNSTESCAHVHSAGDFLAEATTVEVESIAVPLLVEREHRADAAGHLLSQTIETFGDAFFGFIFT